MSAQPSSTGDARPVAGRRVGVVVVTFGAPAGLLESCLTALVASLDPAAQSERDYDVDLYLIDNGGRSLPRLRSTGLANRFDYIVTDNRGFGAAVNEGFDAARSAGAEILVCLNDDIIVEDEWLPPLVDALDSSPTLGGVQSLLVSSDGQRVNSAGVSIDRYGQGQDIDREMLVEDWLSERGRAENGPATSVGSAGASTVPSVLPVPAVTGGAAAYAARLFADIGGFDERFFLYYEDVELCRRGAAAGWWFGLVPTSIVRHRASASTVSLGDNRIVLQERNRLWTSAMWGSPREFVEAALLSVRRLRHQPRTAHRQALVGSLGGIGPRVIDRARPASRSGSRSGSRLVGRSAERGPRPDWTWLPSTNAERRAVDGVNVVGYHHVTSGLGEVVRDFVVCLRAAGVDVVEVDDDLSLSPRRRDPRPVPEVVYDTTVSFATPFETVHFGRRFPTLVGPRSRLIGYWFWELDTIPDSHLDALDIVDEVWAPTRFVRNAYAAAAGVSTPVRLAPLRLPNPTADADRVRRWREDFGADFIFLVSFDYFSFFERKNPTAAIAAFAAAINRLPPARLIVKTINRDKHPERAAEIAAAVGSAVAANPQLDGRIELIDRHLDDDDHTALIAAADCFVSPHRSEGLGLQPAVAMAVGTAVIATEYGGVVDFLDADNSYLVGYDLVGVVDGHGIYPDGAPWADVDHEGLVTAMIDVATDEDTRSAKIAAAHRTIENQNDAAAFGRRYLGLLESLDAYRPDHSDVAAERGRRP